MASAGGDLFLASRNEKEDLALVLATLIFVDREQDRCRTPSLSDEHRSMLRVGPTDHCRSVLQEIGD
ncbi:MAG TPA: hypothetical protein VE127_04780 [Solirubrobacteraceae bacterium]|nr:hypothetical protein [Solirubrobacteraceae bacterium]